MTGGAMPNVVLILRVRRGKNRAVIHSVLGDTGYTRCGVPSAEGERTPDAVDCPRCLPVGSVPPRGHVARQRQRYIDTTPAQGDRKD